MKTALSLSVILLALLAAPSFAAEEPRGVVPLGGRYVGSVSQPKGFNNKDNPYAFTQGASTQDQMRRQFEENKAAYRRGLAAKDSKVAPSKPLLAPVDSKAADKKARCLTGNYDGC